MRKVAFLISIVVVLFAFGLLVTGSPLLLLNLASGGEFPFGTLSTWAGIAALPCAVLSGCHGLYAPADRFTTSSNYLLRACIALGGLWGFTAYIFATNWAINFRPGEGFLGSPLAATYFWTYTVLLVLMPLVILIVYVARPYWRRLRD